MEIESATALADKKIARNNGVERVPETDFRHETEARIVMLDFKIDALYR